MSSKYYNFVLKKLTALLKDDAEAISALELLQKKIKNLPVDETVLENQPESFLLPEEMDGKAPAFAVFSDGACRGNPGPGAWGVLIQDDKGDVILKSSGVDTLTTNNKMELEGAIQSLAWLLAYMEENSIALASVFLYSDSKYVIEGMKSWVPGWKKRGWKKADNKVPENVDLWKKLDELREAFASLSFYWVQGHSGHPQNEYCDRLANQALNEAGF